MLTKTLIVQRLLEQKLITAEEAVVLLRENIFQPIGNNWTQHIPESQPVDMEPYTGDEPGWLEKTKIICEK